MYRYHLGYQGVALCLVLSQWSQLIILILIITLRKLWIFKCRNRNVKNNHKKHPAMLPQGRLNDCNINHDEYDSNRDVENKMNAAPSTVSFSSSSTSLSYVVAGISPMFRRSNGVNVDGASSSSQYRLAHTDSIRSNNSSSNCGLEFVIGDDGHEEEFDDTSSTHPAPPKHRLDNHTTNSNISFNSTRSGQIHAYEDNGQEAAVDEEEEKEDGKDKENNFPLTEPAILDGWPHFLELGVPGAASMFIEW